MKKLTLLTIVSATVFGALSVPVHAQEMEFVTVPKAVGLNWFNRMEEGVVKFGEDNPTITSFQQGPSKFDAALQVQVIEDLIARKVDALNVVPFQADSLEPVLKKAREKGIVVVSHEASDLTNIDYDVEAFDNQAYGRFLMDLLAQGMQEEGQYAVFVGSLTSTTHMTWVNAAIEYQKERYPKMEMVGGINESADDIKNSYAKTRELMRTYPNLKGIQGSSALDVVGAGQAIEESGLEDKITVVGTSIVSYSADLLETGAVDVITGWDPAMAAYAMNSVSKMLLEGKTITDGMDLGVEGYNNIKLDGKVIYGSAWIKITKENMSDYNF
ncbi:autoinducer 2 ABC transporter substrate-binding protein [Vibrio panuliri]|uniref:Autoinducer 2-binding periplasmic protein LuxP n=1 Tax=Vibrio panuliri TaxID=1381081 RepID=A0A1Q9HQQ2_9VIBR|nr:autoinducer 2 ABC transporter substrate-binding protein [Vibrio panuliri]KAB1458042.1 autoinducer 2 ABC transporter substrate-binding protein [Vibrio panuliri]OLQ93162.1 LacI family transcriptional regulator [Vibrio panuliri]OLQ95086.1 LacI family transcriptional regulator [Vibrio panuliri]